VNSSSPRYFGDSKRKIAGELAHCTVTLIWHLLRLPVFLLLVTLEPVASIVLGGLALLVVLTALFFKVIGAPHFPFVLMLAAGLGFQLALIGYCALLRSFSK